MEKITVQQGLDKWQGAMLAGIIALGLIVGKVLLFGG